MLFESSPLQGVSEQSARVAVSRFAKDAPSGRAVGIAASAALDPGRALLDGVSCVPASVSSSTRSKGSERTNRVAVEAARERVASEALPVEEVLGHAASGPVSHGVKRNRAGENVPSSGRVGAAVSARTGVRVRAGAANVGCESRDGSAAVGTERAEEAYSNRRRS